ncbi:chemotaxis protein CheA [Natronospira bacteriovora]|uniref:Chemotaxis protein CheA n=1 Tax=Natronospira bacteriovora TaxID=3069753 RepID=A0ABU0W647_9GAMM|nr:chemotaxis protein CheA [Natronospira sp. AB-CW4]MDQ2069419.1 chemotaxis protein CheA [Natronospira sp. AB-CW4]
MNQADDVSATETDPLLAQFVVEAREQLQSAADGLLVLEQQPRERAAVDAVFRSLHTVKGGAGLFEAPALNRLLHETEQLLHGLRTGELEPDADFVDLLLEAVDQTQAWVDQMAEGGVSNLSGSERAERLVKRIASVLGEGVLASQATPSDHGSPPDVQINPNAMACFPVAALIRSFVHQFKAGASDLRLIRLEPDPEAFLKGRDPLAWAMELPGFLALGVEAAEVPEDLSEMDTFRFNLTLSLLTSADTGTLQQFADRSGIPVEIMTVPIDSLLRLDGDPRPLTAEDDLLDALDDAICRHDGDALERAITVGMNLFGNGLWVYRGLEWLSALQDLGEIPVAWKRAVVEAMKRRCQPCMEDGAGSGVNDDEAWSLPDGGGGLFLSEPSADSTATAEMDPAMVGLFDDAPGMPSEAQVGNSPEVVGTGSEVSEQKVEAGAGNDSGVQAQSRKGPAHVHVDTQRLDQLGELVGELIVARNGLPYLARRAEQDHGSRQLSREIKEQAQLLERVTGELQRAVSAVQMQPVATTFQRFRRLTRDIARKLDKQVELVLEGEGTQADRQVLAAMVDPLTHLVRNSLDHGIESLEERRAAGKPDRGRLLLRARHSGDWLRLEVADDGRGLDPERIAAMALEKGIVSAEELDGMDERERQKLIFAPGFSTADAVSEVSGRGVGMDAVRDTVEALDGQIDLDSVPGEGSCVTLSLPLSMAVTRVLLAHCGRQQLGIPIEAVVEIVRRSPADIQKVSHQPVIMVREEVLPVLDLNQHLGIEPPEETQEPDAVASFVLLHWQSRRVALRVDDVGEDMEVVVKPLEGLLRQSDLFTGHALLGDGRILFILDMKGLLT